PRSRRRRSGRACPARTAWPPARSRRRARTGGAAGRRAVRASVAPSGEGMSRASFAARGLRDPHGAAMSPGSPVSTSSLDRPAAVLVSVQLSGVSDVDHAADLAELGRLVHTLGYDVIATVSQRRAAIAAAAVLGEGKLRQLAAMTGGKGVVPSGAPAKKDK